MKVGQDLNGSGNLEAAGKPREDSDMIELIVPQKSRAIGRRWHHVVNHLTMVMGNGNTGDRHSWWDPDTSVL